MKHGKDWLLVLEFSASGWWLFRPESPRGVWFCCSSYCTIKRQLRLWGWGSSQSPLLPSDCLLLMGKSLAFSEPGFLCLRGSYSYLRHGPFVSDILLVTIHLAETLAWIRHQQMAVATEPRLSELPEPWQMFLILQRQPRARTVRWLTPGGCISLSWTL